MNVNATKKKLADGELVIGSFVYVPSARLTEIVGLLGFDFVVIDMEHGPVDIGMAEDMVRAAECANVTPIIRVSHNTPHLILRALDVGAMGLHVPEIAHVEEAKSMVASAKYGPLGHRGLGGVRASQWGLKGPMPEYTVDANRETMVIAHIEHIDAANNLDQLLEVDGIDVYYVGPVDPVRDEVVGPAGPTTSTRMDGFTAMMLEKTGLLGMIGKAERGPLAIEAIKSHGAVYLMAVGGAAYLVSKAIKRSRVVAFPELGMEAIHEFEVEDMPVTVAVDSKGESVHQTGPRHWQAEIGLIPVTEAG